MTVSLVIGRDRYVQVFEAERLVAAVVGYPIMDAIEAQCGYALPRNKLEDAARVLACPVKANPPNWQHGRLLYALARRYFVGMTGWVTLLDIGTAKGFSALCMQWALTDAQMVGQVVSVDVIDPKSSTRRNTVADCDGAKTLHEILEPWPEAKAIDFRHDTGIGWLMDHPARINIAFVDGKHNRDVVSKEAELLHRYQLPNDLIVFDDVQIDGVRDAVMEMRKGYDIEFMALKPERQYAVARKR